MEQLPNKRCIILNKGGPAQCPDKAWGGSNREDHGSKKPDQDPQGGKRGNYDRKEKQRGAKKGKRRGDGGGKKSQTRKAKPKTIA